MQARENRAGVQAAVYRKLICPNRSLSTTAMLWLFLAYTVFALSLGIGFAVVGAWMVLPFTCLEIAVVAAVFYFLFRHAGDYELVIVDDSRLKVVRRWGDSEVCDEFQRYWVKVFLAPGAGGWYPSRLRVGSHGRMVEVGAAMSEEARQALARDLKNAVRR
jgi:uncharacterized membrane protein